MGIILFVLKKEVLFEEKSLIDSALKLLNLIINLSFFGGFIKSWVFSLVLWSFFNSWAFEKSIPVFLT